MQEIQDEPQKLIDDLEQLSQDQKKYIDELISKPEDEFIKLVGQKLKQFEVKARKLCGQKSLTEEQFYKQIDKHLKNLNNIQQKIAQYQNKLEQNGNKVNLIFENVQQKYQQLQQKGLEIQEIIKKRNQQKIREQEQEAERRQQQQERENRIKELEKQLQQLGQDSSFDSKIVDHNDETQPYSQYQQIDCNVKKQIDQLAEQYNTEQMKKEAQNKISEIINMQLYEKQSQMIQNLGLIQNSQKINQNEKKIQQEFKNVAQDLFLNRISNIIDFKQIEKVDTEIDKQQQQFQKQIQNFEHIQNIVSLFQQNQQIKPILNDLKQCQDQKKAIPKTKVEVKNGILEVSGSSNFSQLHEYLSNTFQKIKYMKLEGKGNEKQTLRGGGRDQHNGSFKTGLSEFDLLKDKLASLKVVQEMLSKLEKSENANNKNIQSVKELKQRTALLINNMQNLQSQNISIENKQSVLKYFEQHAKIDLAFVIDTTATMDKYLKKVKSTSLDIIKQIQNRYKNADIQIGFVFYKDHLLDYQTEQQRDQNLFQPKPIPFTSNIEQAIRKLKQIEVSGGDDIHEAVFDGINYAFTKLKWRSHSARLAILILDSPPHGKEYFQDHEEKLQNIDFFPQGCPCDKKIEEIQKCRNQRGIHLAVKATKHLPNTNKIFKSIFKQNYEYQVIGQQNLKEQVLKSIEEAMQKYKEQIQEIQNDIVRLIEQVRQKIIKQLEEAIMLEQNKKYKNKVKQCNKKIEQKLNQIKNINEIKQIQKDLQQLRQLFSNMSNSNQSDKLNQSTISITSQQAVVTPTMKVQVKKKLKQLKKKRFTINQQNIKFLSKQLQCSEAYLWEVYNQLQD